MRCFISQSVYDTVGATENKDGSTFFAAFLSAIVSLFIQYSTKLHKTVKQYYNDAINARKNSAKNLF